VLPSVWNGWTPQLFYHSENWKGEFPPLMSISSLGLATLTVLLNWLLMLATLRVYYFGAPVFVTLGGAALILPTGADLPIASIRWIITGS
jgi:hypothetical protein